MERLVIGIGNPDRADDAAGVLVVGQLRRDRTKTLNDCVGLIDVWGDADDVIVVDAMISGQPVGTVTELDGRSEFRAATFPSTHSFGLVETIELGKALDRLPESLTIYGIEGANFEPGDDPSPEVLKGVAMVVERIEAGRH